jgi:hypothetical protein
VGQCERGKPKQRHCEIPHSLLFPRRHGINKPYLRLLADSLRNDSQGWEYVSSQCCQNYDSVSTTQDWLSETTVADMHQSTFQLPRQYAHWRTYKSVSHKRITHMHLQANSIPRFTQDMQLIDTQLPIAGLNTFEGQSFLRSRLHLGRKQRS